MNLFEQVKYELLYEAERTPTKRKQAATDTQKKDIIKIVGAIKDRAKEFAEVTGRESKDIIGNPGTGSKNKEDVRLKAAGTNLTLQWVEDAAKSSGAKIDKINTIQKGNPLSCSGTFDTYQIVSGSGAEIFVVLAGAGKSAGAKQFTPNKFNIEGKEYNYKELSKVVEQKIDKVKTSEDVKKYLKYLLRIATKGTIRGNDSELTIAKEDFDESIIDGSDKKKIQNDFGEILSAIAASRHEDMEPIEFPKSATEPLVDFTAGDFRYSVKSISGASPTLTSVATKYEDFVKYEMEGTPEEKKNIIKMFEYLGEKKLKVEQTYLAIGKAVDPDKLWKAFIKLMGGNDFDPLLDNSIVKEKIHERLDELFDQGTLEQELEEFYDILNTRPKSWRINKISEYDKNADWRHGYILVGFEYYLPKFLNKVDTTVKDQMVQVINQMHDVKQINFYNDNDQIRFKIKSFIDDDIDIEFTGGGKLTQPNNQNLRFKIHN